MIAISEEQALALEGLGVKVETCYAVPRKLIDLLTNAGNPTPVPHVISPARVTAAAELTEKKTHVKYMALHGRSMLFAKALKNPAKERSVGFVWHFMKLHGGNTFHRAEVVAYFKGDYGQSHSQATSSAWYLLETHVTTPMPAPPKQLNFNL
tara:strand:+ start:143 stop:598 length:456 start_codon:yes stop_codon:yes gene_type:complete